MQDLHLAPEAIFLLHQNETELLFSSAELFVSVHDDSLKQEISCNVWLLMEVLDTAIAYIQTEIKLLLHSHIPMVKWVLLLVQQHQKKFGK